LTIAAKMLHVVYIAILNYVETNGRIFALSPCIFQTDFVSGPKKTFALEQIFKNIPNFELLEH